MKISLLFIYTSIILGSCKLDKDPTYFTQAKENYAVKVPLFNPDSAYQHIRTQLDFGYRIVGTPAGKHCREWLTDKLTGYNFIVTQQEFKVHGVEGFEQVTGTNIIAHHNPEIKERILLCAHYDTRHIADKDSINVNEPIAGADDGASGVAVLLEVARLITQLNLPLGVDIVFFDAEDIGIDNRGTTQSVDTWGLGSQYWATNVKNTNYEPEYGILLDMVGAKRATFPKEGISVQTAKSKVDRIWSMAEQMGYSKYFVNQQAQGITDDHYFIVRNAGIPMIDIIHLEPDQTFGDYHHTHQDNLDIINKKTLGVVGQVVIATLVHESNGVF